MGLKFTLTWFCIYIIYICLPSPVLLSPAMEKETFFCYVLSFYFDFQHWTRAPLLHFWAACTVSVLQCKGGRVGKSELQEVYYVMTTDTQEWAGGWYTEGSATMSSEIHKLYVNPSQKIMYNIAVCSHYFSYCIKSNQLHPLHPPMVLAVNLCEDDHI